MRTIACEKTIRKTALLDLLLNTANGMRGYSAKRCSLKKKKPIISVPNTIKKITFGLFQGNIVPPKSSPTRSRVVIARIESVPYQSMALRPSPSFVRGLLTSGKRSKRPNGMPHMGTLIQKHQRQETDCVKAPPISGPADPSQSPHKPRETQVYRSLAYAKEI